MYVNFTHLSYYLIVCLVPVVIRVLTYNQKENREFYVTSSLYKESEVKNWKKKEFLTEVRRSPLSLYIMSVRFPLSVKNVTLYM